MRLIICFGAFALLAGCDASKDELESTKATLTTVTKERDDFKSQLAAAQQQIATDKAELAKAKTAEAATKAPAPANGKSATAPATPAAKSKNPHKS